MQERQTFIDAMERQFGSDAALGVRFRLESGEEVSAAEYDVRFAKLDRGARPGIEESLLADGGSAVCCTDYACFIFKRLPGRVQIFGFANAANPSSRVAREQIHPGGHDFAVVDGRYLVDPWPRLVPAVFAQMVFDMQESADAVLVADIYGPRDCWERMEVAEQHALGLLVT